jgi:type IV pilus assembly protein PilA
MKSAKLQQGFSLLEWLILISMFGILASIAVPSYCDYIVRAKITEGLALAAAAKTAVAENAANGKPFTTGWIAPNATINVSTKALPTKEDRVTNVYSGVAINPTNGIITITYTDKVQTGSPFVLLIPLTDKKTLPVSGEAIKAQITWECHSATAPANDEMQNLLGTLNQKYVPANCRS